MAARNGPNAVEGQLKRKVNEVHSRINGDHQFCPYSGVRKTYVAALSKIRRRAWLCLSVCGYMWLCDDFVTAFLKPNSSSFSLTNMFSSRSTSNC
ncbi:hypothetical protein AVEN_213314-1 [Araneus ventricosus]|uniref:Uncharacterized protein n=1 Tax=Araneus ventricosus TaxID=182803 RepID=A0A4Y2LDZ2_ARAVE|nr:hypothetical protein AVEN_258556-1 [Araneus ventricosus]GBN11697.1 hypothetical protein AVEN_84890-1 [Araneus ventricosus]GBN11836.1 hypothetical protein AVEN_213314-1 [Araneus ventricosus]